MKRGAVDYLTKPFRLPDLDVVIRKAFRSGHLERENRHLRQALARSQPCRRMIGNSPAMGEVRRLIQRVGPSDKPVLIEGESGTGKELVARAIHEASSLAKQPLIVINCAALPETLLESELFGHEKGAFTGASEAKPGLFEVADGGTLFIDEFGELAGSLQAKLLRVLEDGMLRRIGSIRERRVRVRLIAATNRDLATEVRAGRFREDLYYRVNVLSIRIPPLRDRMEDIPLLIRHFLGDGWKVEPGVMQVLETYSWPGNIRQLQNALERAKILADDGTIHLENLPLEFQRNAVASGHLLSTPNNLQMPAVSLPIPVRASAGDPVDLESLSRMHVLEVLRRNGGNKAKSARALGIGRRSLYRLLEKFGEAKPNGHESAVGPETAAAGVQGLVPQH